MTTLTRLERVLRHDGIVAVLDMTAEQAQGGDGGNWVGDSKWRPIVVEAVRLRATADEPSVRVLIGDFAVLISGEGDHVVGVVFIKGHPVVKSVVRMVRQLLRAATSSKGAGAALPDAAEGVAPAAESARATATATATTPSTTTTASGSGSPTSPEVAPPTAAS